MALSSFTILGGALANTAVNLLRTDIQGQSLIDWNIIVMMEPATIAGTIVGSYFSKCSKRDCLEVLLRRYLPDFVLMVFLSIVLAILAFRTLDKASMCRSEVTVARAWRCFITRMSMLTRSRCHRRSERSNLFFIKFDAQDASEEEDVKEFLP